MSTKEVKLQARDHNKTAKLKVMNTSRALFTKGKTSFPLRNNRIEKILQKVHGALNYNRPCLRPTLRDFVLVGKEILPQSRKNVTSDAIKTVY